MRSRIRIKLLIRIPFLIWIRNQGFDGKNGEILQLKKTKIKKSRIAINGIYPSAFMKEVQATEKASSPKKTANTSTWIRIRISKADRADQSQCKSTTLVFLLLSVKKIILSF
jgi:hypothetical protein